MANLCDIYQLWPWNNNNISNDSVWVIYESHLVYVLMALQFIEWPQVLLFSVHSVVFLWSSIIMNGRRSLCVPVCPVKKPWAENYLRNMWNSCTCNCINVKVSKQVLLSTLVSCKIIYGCSLFQIYLFLTWYFWKVWFALIASHYQLA